MKITYLLLIFILASCSVIPSGNYYKVKNGDDPIIISRKMGVSLCSLRDSNKKRNFLPGEYIFIPQGGGIFGQVDYCGPTENLLVNGKYLWPLKGKNYVSSGYGMRWGKHHNGIDIPAKTGTPIRAAKEGKVTFSGWHFGGYGFLTIISHYDGTSTYYAHARKNLYRKGKWVKKGKIIAEVGSSGNTTGPHLHFEIRKMGTAINPMEFYSMSI